MKPKTDRDWAFYRVALNCDVGLDVLKGDIAPPDGSTVEQYALYTLLEAVKRLAEAIRGDDGCNS